MKSVQEKEVKALLWNSDADCYDSFQICNDEI